MKIFTITGMDKFEARDDIHSLTKTLHCQGSEAMQVSDGYHTMDEVYEHRIALFITLCRLIKCCQGDFLAYPPWRSKQHHPEDKPMFGGWFVMGLGGEKPGEQITYHLPLSRWEETDFAETLDHAPRWDGHTSADVLERIAKL